jgi:hypothetical protein
VGERPPCWRTRERVRNETPEKIVDSSDAGERGRGRGREFDRNDEKESAREEERARESARERERARGSAREREGARESAITRGYGSPTYASINLNPKL